MSPIRFSMRAIGSVADVQSGYAFKSKDWRPEGIPVIKIANVKDGRVVMEGCSYVEPEVAEQAFRYRLRRGDILISMTGYIGEVALVRTNEHMMLNQRVGRFTVSGSDYLDSLFLFYALRQNSLKREMQAHAYGAAQPNISPTLIKQLEIPFPPVDIQKRIASVLSAYDDLIENNTRRIAILEEMAQAIYREWFVNFRFPGHEQLEMVESELGPVPVGWDVSTVGQLSAYIKRGIAPSYDDQGGSIAINQRCIRDGRLRLELVRRQAKRIPSEKQVQFGDVLLNSTGVGTLGRVAQVYHEIPNCTVDTHVTIVRPGPAVGCDVWGLMLMSLEPHFERLGFGSTGQTELGRDSVAEVPAILPPRSLQDRFGSIVRPMRESVMNLLARDEILRQTRDLLLPRLISGEIDVAAMEEELAGTG